MYKENLRQTVKTLYEQGKHKKQIARILKINIKTVRKILNENEDERLKPRINKIMIDSDLLTRLYKQCNGYLQRIHEILIEEHGISIGYSTLTNLFRELGIGKTDIKRSMQFPDLPGEEMQHDTSIYQILLGNKKTKVVCSGLYFRYSKMRYIKFYPFFTRFCMKGFFHEALLYLGYTAKYCIIDNTNLAVYSGTGENAVFSREMVVFAINYGFEWKAHRIGHANRKAGTERNFYTVETNFFPGRSFSDFEDLNKQAFNWACHRYAKRPLSRTKLIPVQLFEVEKDKLIKVDSNILPPYKTHQRLIDQYGFIALNANYYWIPKKVNERKIIGRKVIVIEYQQTISIYQKRELLISYPKAAYSIKNQKIMPDDMRGKINTPSNLKKTYQEEENKLRAIAEVVGEYLDFIMSKECKLVQKFKFIRNLYALSKKMAPSLFIKSIERALKYLIDDLSSIQRISLQILKNDCSALTELINSDDFQSRTAYRDGLFSEESDLNIYQDLIDNGESES